MATQKNTQELLTSVLSTKKELAAEAKRRKSLYDSETIRHSLVEEYRTEGWEVERQLTYRTRMRRTRGLDRQLEDRVWTLLYLLGFPELNEGRTCEVQIRRDGTCIPKQIDVFARDEETIVVAECKSSEIVRRRSLQKDIEEFANLKGPMAQSFRDHYGPNFKPKVVWLMVTQNIIWSRPDRERAAGEHIGVITERELRYFAQVADHLGLAARYQFLAEFLRDQKIPQMGNRAVPAIRGRLGGRKFYSFVTTPGELLKISFVNHRSLNDPEGAPSYQRLVSVGRLRQIGKFISGGGYFPTNILVNFVRPIRFDIVQRDVSADVAFGQLYLPDRYKSAWIIDGQHRLYGYAHLDPKHLSQNIMVVAFEQLDATEEANLFVTINHEQKSVPKNLLDALEGELKWGSSLPSERIGAIASRLISLLDTDFGEPFYGRVTQQDIRATDATCLTVPALKDGLRRSGLLGRATMGRKIYELGPLCGPTDMLTLDRARHALDQYFDIIRNANRELWDLGRSGHLCTNVAVQGYTLLLADLISYAEGTKGFDARALEPAEIVIEVQQHMTPILSFLSQAGLPEMEEAFRVPFGSGGVPAYRFKLATLVQQAVPGFAPLGLADWQQEQSDEQAGEADWRLKQLNIEVQRHIFRRLRDEYGEENEAYWHQGVPDMEIRTQAYRKSLEDGERRLHPEHYLDFIQYKKIVENSANWHLFKDVFDIPEPNRKSQGKNLHWMDRINELRRIPAHSTEKRVYRTEDVDYIQFTYDEFTRRLAADQHGAETP